MKTYLSAFISFMLIQLIFLSCHKSEEVTPEPNSFSPFIGLWDNVNPYNDGIISVAITRTGANQLSVQMWSYCVPQWCDWGESLTTVEDANDGTLSIYWEHGDLVRRQEISLAEGGKLQVITREHFPGEAETENVDYFSKAISESLFQQVTIADLNETTLSRNLIYGGPDEFNQLTSGSIVVYRTNEGRYGKFQVRGNWAILTMRWETWNPDGSVYRGGNYLAVLNQRYIDLDEGEDTGEAERSKSDFQWLNDGEKDRWLIPVNNAAFALFHLEN